MLNYVHKDDCKIEVKFSKFAARFSIKERMAQFVKIPSIVFRLARSIFRHYLNYCLRAQYTIPTNDLCHETCRVMFIKMTPTSNFLLAHPKMAQLVKIPFIVFHLTRLMFTGQSSHLDMVNPKHSSFFRTLICQGICILEPLWLSKTS